MVKVEHLRIGDRLKDKDGNIFRVQQIDSKDEDLPVRVELVHDETFDDEIMCWVGPKKNGRGKGDDLTLDKLTRLLNLYEPVHDADGNIYSIVKDDDYTYHANLIKASNPHVPQGISFELGSEQYKPLYEEFEDPNKLKLEECQVGDLVGDTFGNRYIVLDLDLEDDKLPIRLLPVHVEQSIIYTELGPSRRVALLRTFWVLMDQNSPGYGEAVRLTVNELVKLENTKSENIDAIIKAFKHIHDNWEE